MSSNLTRAIIFSVILIVLFPAPGFAKDCFDCHDRGAFSGKVRHQPVVKGECATCHSTHASRFPGLLRDATEKLCYECHDDFEKSLNKRDFIHKPVKNGECSACHEPHVADFNNLLKVKPGTECYDCHKKQEKAYVFPHAPFAKNQCYRCHDPHGADDSRLLREQETKLCLGCHKIGVTFKKSHLNRNPEELACLSCHHPHGGETVNLLRPVQHDPFQKGKCNTCHGKSQAGAELCLKCHKNESKSFLQPHTHLRIAVDGVNFCLDCHNPHAGDDAGLPSSDQVAACASCHQAKFAKRQKMLYHHPGRWDCGDCHKVHGADSAMMLKSRPLELCADCHKRHEQFTHPIGDDSLDPRNFEPMTCVTCHDPCTGTMFKYNLRGNAERGLCIQCHPKH